MMENIKVGFAMCGSFCTFQKVIPQVKELCDAGFEVTPIMSETAYSTDTYFGKAKDYIDEIENICKKKILHTISEVEPIGPKKLFDAMVVAPCTGNTLAKLNYGITDSSVTMAVKAHVRNQKPVILAISTNDALSASAGNIGRLLNRKYFYFVPFGQDNPGGKPRSMVADMTKIKMALELALTGEQIQPILCSSPT